MVSSLICLRSQAAAGRRARRTLWIVGLTFVLLLGACSPPTPATPAAHFDFDAVPDDAIVRLNGATIAHGDPADYGDLQLEISRRGFEPMRVSVSVTADGPVVVRPGAWERVPASLDLSGLAVDTVVYLNGTRVRGAVDLAPGATLIRLERPGYEAHEIATTLAPAERRRVEAPEWKPLRVELDLSAIAAGVNVIVDGSPVNGSVTVPVGPVSLRLEREAHVAQTHDLIAESGAPLRVTAEPWVPRSASVDLGRLGTGVSVLLAGRDLRHGAVVPLGQLRIELRRPGHETQVVHLVAEAGAIVSVPAPARWTLAEIGPETAQRLLGSATAWTAASSVDRRRVARCVERRTIGFKFDRLQRFVALQSDLAHAPEIAVFVHVPSGLEFSLVPAGEFQMGSPESETGRRLAEGPLHRVEIARPFLMARTEVTQRAWDRIGGTDARRERDADRPIEGVTWDESLAWCERAGLRLPSEAEWEFACRAGTDSAYWSGNEESDLLRVGWVRWNSRGARETSDRAVDHVAAESLEEERRQTAGCRTQRVGEKPPNALGLHDVHGNVGEWCQDTESDNYEGAPSDGSAWQVDGPTRRRREIIERYPALAEQLLGTARIARGGCHTSVTSEARAASRASRVPATRGMYLGFRPACSVMLE